MAFTVYPASSMAAAICNILSIFMINPPVVDLVCQRSCAVMCPVLKSVVLAEMGWQFLSTHPLQIPACCPWPGIGTRIINRDLVVQGVLIDPGKTFFHFQLICMGQTTVGKPEVFIEAVS